MTPKPVINHVHEADVTRVIDGDTFIARIELDFRVRVDITVRVRDYSVPELNTLEGQLARNELIERLAAAGNKITILSYKDHMSFARWVCDVWIGDSHLHNATAVPLRATG